MDNTLHIGVVGSACSYGRKQCSSQHWAACSYWELGFLVCCSCYLQGSGGGLGYGVDPAGAGGGSFAAALTGSGRRLGSDDAEYWSRLV